MYIQHLLQLHCLWVDKSKEWMDFFQAFVQDDVNLSRSNNEYLSLLKSHDILYMSWK